MIRYTLHCANDHSFDSWFQSADAFDKLKAAGMVACAICGGTKVEKSLMAPAVRPGRKDAAHREESRREETRAETPAPGAGALSAPASPMEEALARLRRHVEETSDYVGADFAREARAMHAGDQPDRPIWGEARPEEARALIEEGVPVAPLPFMTGRKTN